ncbi:hypothetical protein QUH24_24530, partial [Klebsiella pneumoniae]
WASWFLISRANVRERFFMMPRFRYVELNVVDTKFDSILGKSAGDHPPFFYVTTGTYAGAGSSHS